MIDPLETVLAIEYDSPQGQSTTLSTTLEFLEDKTSLSTSSPRSSRFKCPVSSLRGRSDVLNLVEPPSLCVRENQCQRNRPSSPLPWRLPTMTHDSFCSIFTESVSDYLLAPRGRNHGLLPVQGVHTPVSHVSSVFRRCHSTLRPPFSSGSFSLRPLLCLSTPTFFWSRVHVKKRTPNQ